MLKVLKPLIGFVFLFYLAGCGGGADTSLQSGGPTGKVTLVLTDAPSDAFESVEITVQSITFIGGDGHVPVPLPDDQSVSVDLLDLEGLNMFLAQAVLPVGTYQKIRLEVSDPKMILEGGEEVPSENVHLVAGGKIDLNPQGFFHVSEEEDLVIQLDFDVEKSLHIHESKNGKYVIRPVVFVNVQDASTPPLDLEGIVGVIQEIHYSEEAFLLRTGRHMAVRVLKDEDTMIFDSDGNPLLFDQLETRLKVEVEGVLIENGTVLASSITVMKDYARRHGIIKDLNRDLQEFILIQRDLSEQIVKYSDETFVHIRREKLSTEDLSNGQRVWVSGVLNTEPGKLLAKRIRIKGEYFRGFIAGPPKCPEAIQVVNPWAKLYRLRLVGIELQPENTVTVQIGSAKLVDPKWRPLSCKELAEGQPVRVFGRIIPHTPDDQDPNPIQVLAYKVKQLKQAHAVGEILSIHPNADNPEVGTFVMGLDIPGIYWNTDQNRAVNLPLRVWVNQHTQFEDGMSFGTLFVGQEVMVKGFFTFRYHHPHITLVAVQVGSVPDDLTNSN